MGLISSIKELITVTAETGTVVVRNFNKQVKANNTVAEMGNNVDAIEKAIAHAQRYGKLCQKHSTEAIAHVEKQLISCDSSLANLQKYITNLDEEE